MKKIIKVDHKKIESIELKNRQITINYKKGYAEIYANKYDLKIMLGNSSLYEFVINAIDKVNK